MGRLTVVIVALVTVAASTTASRLLASQTTQTETGILPGCGIPHAYGRLAEIVPGATGGGAGAAAQAVFEAEDGTIRWVSMVQAGLRATPPLTSGTTNTVRPAFLPNYECALSGEWRRH
jgi:hypothetical protein